jgi:hypothetical protein
MSEYSSIRRVKFFVAAFVVTAILALYAYMEKLFTFEGAAQKFTSVYDQCVAHEGVQQERKQGETEKNNPNKMLFISCGGMYE